MVHVSDEVRAALSDGRPVVALESTLIAHGLPQPLNRDVAKQAELTVRQAGAIPATIAIIDGEPIVGLDARQIDRLATESGILKASRRDLATAIAQRKTAATTVAGTMALAHRAGISVFATGGIGGVHDFPDVSADLVELAKTPVAVVCSGAKSILDIPATLELLETLGVPVVGYGCYKFPAFYLTSVDQPVSLRLDTPADIARFLQAHWELDGRGVVIAQPPPLPMDPKFFQTALKQAHTMADQHGISGPALTPYLLKQLGELTNGETLQSNAALIVANANLAAQIAIALHSAT